MERARGRGRVRVSGSSARPPAERLYAREHVRIRCRGALHAAAGPDAVALPDVASLAVVPLRPVAPGWTDGARHGRRGEPRRSQDSRVSGADGYLASLFLQRQEAHVLRAARARPVARWTGRHDGPRSEALPGRQARHSADGGAVRSAGAIVVGRSRSAGVHTGPTTEPRSTPTERVPGRGAASAGRRVASAIHRRGSESGEEISPTLPDAFLSREP